MHVLNPGISDHSPMLLKDLSTVPGSKGRLFKFLNYVAKEATFLEVVRDNWKLPVRGTSMFCLWKKLLRRQPNFRGLNKKYNGVASRITKTKAKLDSVQSQLAMDSFNTMLLHKEKECRELLLLLQQTKEEILAQRAKVEWLQLGDGNNSYFSCFGKG